MVLRGRPTRPAGQDISESRRGSGLVGSVGKCLVVDTNCLCLQTLDSGNQSCNVTLESELCWIISARELD